MSWRTALIGVIVVVLHAAGWWIAAAHGDMADQVPPISQPSVEAVP